MEWIEALAVLRREAVTNPKSPPSGSTSRTSPGGRCRYCAPRRPNCCTASGKPVNPGECGGCRLRSRRIRHLAAVRRPTPHPRSWRRCIRRELPSHCFSGELIVRPGSWAGPASADVPPRDTPLRTLMSTLPLPSDCGQEHRPGTGLDSGAFWLAGHAVATAEPPGPHLAGEHGCRKDEEHGRYAR